MMSGGHHDNPDKLVCKDCLRYYMADLERESQRVVVLLKRTMKDSFSELAAILPAQFTAQQTPGLDKVPDVPGP